MSDEKHGASQSSELSRTWSFTALYPVTSPGRERLRSLGPLSFGRAFLFSPEYVLEKEREALLAVEEVQCPVCRASLNKLAKYCWSCGEPVNRDTSYENSW